MKNLSSSLLSALLILSSARTAFAANETFNCVPDDSQNNSDYDQVKTLAFSVEQNGSTISFVSKSLVSNPEVADFKLINLNTKLAEDSDGTPATSTTDPLFVMGRDIPHQQAMLLAMDIPGANGNRRMIINVYPTSPQSQEPIKELHMLCK
jgi:hypothetical protein